MKLIFVLSFFVFFLGNITIGIHPNEAVPTLSLNKAEAYIKVYKSCYTGSYSMDNPDYGSYIPRWCGNCHYNYVQPAGDGDCAIYE